MEENPERLRESFRAWTTERLKKAITVDNADYEPEAINIIKEELQLRNVTKKDLDSFLRSYIGEEESLISRGKLFCPNCHSLNIREEFPQWLGWIPFIRWLKSVTPKYRCDDCGYFFSC